MSEMNEIPEIDHDQAQSIFWDGTCLTLGDGKEFELAELLAAGFASLCPDADPALGAGAAEEFVKDFQRQSRTAYFWDSFGGQVALWANELSDGKNKPMTSHHVGRRLLQLHEECKEKFEAGEGRAAEGRDDHGR